MSAGKILTFHSLKLQWMESVSLCLLKQPPCPVCQLSWVVGAGVASIAEAEYWKLGAPRQKRSNCCCAVKVPEARTVQQGARRLGLGFGKVSWNAVMLPFPRWGSTSSPHTRWVSKMIKGTRLQSITIFFKKERCHVFPLNNSSCSACDREPDAAALRKGSVQWKLQSRSMGLMESALYSACDLQPLLPTCLCTCAASVDRALLPVWHSLS